MVLDVLWELLYFLHKAEQSVEYEDGSSELLPNQFVLIATGSRPQTLPF